MHLAVADIDKIEPTVKFYRLTIKASSSNLKSTLRMGYYDANTLRDAFGEVRAASRPQDSQRNTGELAFAFDPATKAWRYVQPSELFTIIYGADAQALEGAIKAYADSDEAGQTLGRLLAAAAGSGVFREAATAEQDLKKQLAKAKLVAADFKAESTTISGWVTAEKIAADKNAEDDTAAKQAQAKVDAFEEVEGKTPAENAAAKKVLTDNAKVAADKAAASVRTFQAARTSLAPAEVDKALLRLVQATAKQLGSSTPIDDDPATGFDQATQLYNLLQHNSGK
ncbi:hypothetical protein [Oleiharenicola lentus]|uniref:hypothetical protein n=1 Tax=Oleiharenicola lentus TaxID=2508720 RepID=UPI003F674AAF